jgi:hypothetical protein
VAALRDPRHREQVRVAILEIIAPDIADMSLAVAQEVLHG